MPLKINLGLSKKVGEANYGSRGASINLEVEVDSTLVAEPVKFQERVRQLYGLVRASLADGLNGHGHGHTAPSTNDPDQVNGSESSNGQAKPLANGERPRPATAAQIKAINAIAHRQKIDLMPFLQNRIDVGRVGELTLKQASQVIDELKALAPQGE